MLHAAVRAAARHQAASYAHDTLLAVQHEGVNRELASRCKDTRATARLLLCPVSSGGAPGRWTPWRVCIVCSIVLYVSDSSGLLELGCSQMLQPNTT